jgi:hypothetical protein
MEDSRNKILGLERIPDFKNRYRSGGNFPVSNLIESLSQLLAAKKSSLKCKNVS